MNIDEPLIYTGFPMSQMDENQIDLDREDIFFFEIFKDRFENNSLENFTIYWQYRNRPIVL